MTFRLGCKPRQTYLRARKSEQPRVLSQSHPARAVAEADQAQVVDAGWRRSCLARASPSEATTASFLLTVTSWRHQVSAGLDTAEAAVSSFAAEAWALLAPGESMDALERPSHQRGR
jgi:hypothetical protein